MAGKTLGCDLGPVYSTHLSPRPARSLHAGTCSHCFMFLSSLVSAPGAELSRQGSICLLLTFFVRKDFLPC